MSDSLTSEALRKSFKNSFELTLFAIEMGRYHIRGGDSSLSGILNEVRKHPSEDYLTALKDLDKEEKTSS